MMSDLMLVWVMCGCQRTEDVKWTTVDVIIYVSLVLTDTSTVGVTRVLH